MYDIDFLRPLQSNWPYGNVSSVIARFGNARHIFVVGIGGSDLAAKAVWEALTQHTSPEKKMYFLEAPDHREYEELTHIIHTEIQKLEDIVLIVVSKSGTTQETLETFEHLFAIISEKFGGQINGRVIAITSTEGTLHRIAKKRAIEIVEWEGNVGGRFSAFTLAHTVPLAIAGIDILKYMEGGKSADVEEAREVAREIIACMEHGVTIWDFFLFNQELEDMGMWARQLVAESLGILTPTVSIGPRDLHSQLELYLGGPRNRFTLFVHSKKEIEDEINEESYKNVTAAFSKAGLPYRIFEVEEIDEKAIGRFFAFMMIVVVEIAKLRNIDPYDQPSVDQYKAHITKLES